MEQPGMSYGAQPPVAAGPPVPDPISKSAAVTGGVANCMVAIPFVGGIVAIILGAITLGKARRGKEAVESSNGQLRGKGAYMAGKIMGWAAIGFGAFMTIYYIIILIAILARH